uniref:Uncharacterized protein n=1 Tax=Rhizophora mucronata TaxID=61149 RepID=A0A2P2NRS0_RHIMU
MCHFSLLLKCKSEDNGLCSGYQCKSPTLDVRKRRNTTLNEGTYSTSIFAPLLWDNLRTIITHFLS